MSTRIVVDPDHLRRLGATLNREAARISDVERMVSGATGRLHWEVRQRANIEGSLNNARNMSRKLSTHTQDMARYLDRKAGVFADADNAYRGGADLLDASRIVRLPPALSFPEERLRRFSGSYKKYLEALGLVALSAISPLGWIAVRDQIVSIRNARLQSEGTDRNLAREFEKSGELNNEDIDAYINATFPRNHLDGIPKIRYITLEEYDREGYRDYFAREYPKFKGQPPGGWYSEEDGSIVVVPQKSRSAQRTIAHEIGHNVQHKFLTEDERINWDRISDPNDERRFITTYSRTNDGEDFAECYDYYINDPIALRHRSPEKYDFMRDHVFDGREYPYLDTSAGTELYDRVRHVVKTQPEEYEGGGGRSW